MIKIISPLNKIEQENIYSIFLAGPCPRVNYSDDWRFEAISLLEKAGFNGIIYNPTNPNYDTNDSDYLKKQTVWEVTAMQAANKVIFWIPRSLEHPAFTTNIELGQFLWEDKINKFIIGMPPEAIKNNYIKVRLDLLGKKYYETLPNLIDEIIKEMQDDR